MFAGVDLDIIKAPPFGYFIHTMVFNGAVSQSIGNSTVINTGNPGSNGLGGLRIGSAFNSTFFFNGGLAEIIVYDSLLTLTDRIAVENYLKNKYAPPVYLGSDTTIAHGFCPYKLSPGKGYASYLWSTGSTADSILVSETGDYWVQATDIFGRISRDTVYVEYPYSPLPDRGLCILDTITANTGLDHAYTFVWNDSSSDSLLRVWAPGQYWVEITDSTLAACSVRDTFVVVADSFAVHASLGPDTSICSGNDIALVSGIESGIIYNWNTGFAGSNLVINSAGTYWLEATNVSGCVALDTINVSIKGIKPVSVFTGSTVCKGDSTALIDFSFTVAPDDIAAWNWDFDGSGTSTVQNPKHVFPAAGDFMVNLQVISDSGCVGDTAISIHVRNLPMADFLPNNGCNGQAISFGDSSDVAEGSIIGWDWDFGDGSFSLLPNPIYTYSDTGIYDVSLTVADVYGCQSTILQPLNVRLTPVADFIFNEVCLGTKTSFVETTDMPSYAEIIYRLWFFGDGNSSVYQNPLHTYDTPDLYTVTLVNRSLSGCADTVTKVVNVYPFPVVGFEWDLACDGQPVCFTDTSSVAGGIISMWSWDFGDGNNSLLQNPCFIFADTGSYPVDLTVTSEFGCEASADTSIQVFPVPFSDFSVIPEYGTPPLSVQFYNLSTGAQAQQWYFGDGLNSASLNPSHTYTSESIFDVLLVSENSFGCTDTAFGNVYVIPSTLDLVLTQLMVNDSGGYLRLSAVFFNNGTRNIRQIALDAMVGNNIPIREQWEGLLEPGHTGTYSFVSSFRKPDNNSVKLICVELSTLDAYGQEDVNPADNVSCYSLFDEFFIASVFPNPANNEVYADISIPEDGDVGIELVSRDGKQLFQSTLEDIDAGTLRIKIDLKLYANGMYMIRATYKDKTETCKFVKE